MVREWSPPAREPGRSWLARRSTIATSTPANANSPANISPVGPPPAYHHRMFGHTPPPIPVRLLSSARDPAVSHIVMTALAIPHRHLDDTLRVDLYRHPIARPRMIDTGRDSVERDAVVTQHPQPHDGTVPVGGRNHGVVARDDPHCLGTRDGSARSPFRSTFRIPRKRATQSSAGVTTARPAWRPERDGLRAGSRRDHRARTPRRRHA